MKSRAAFVKAQEWGIANIYVYQAGVFEWAKAYPEYVEFMGKPISGDPSSHFLATEKYLAHCLTPHEFVAASHEPQTVVFDIRDVSGRNVFPVDLPNMKYFPVDRLVKLIVSNSRKITRNKVLILDTCGAQSKWLQYVLEDAGVKNYHFLEGGVVNWQKMGLGSTGQQQVQ